jgi:transposase
MEVIHSRCAGLDVHKKSVVACIRIVEGNSVRHEVRTFGTTTSALYELADWLSAEEVTHAAMESTGVYWKPVWHILEECCELVLANAQHIRNVPGRKTDVNDATWIADLLAHGLIRGSFVPERGVQELRELTRTRKQFVRERSRYVQRIQKVLEDANIKLASVISNVVGKSGRAILTAVIAGESDPRKLARLAQGLKASEEALAEALRGHVTDHHRFMLKLYLEQLDALDAAIAAIERQAEAAMRPFREAAELLVTMPGVSTTVATAMVAELGCDMARFPTRAHLISWAGLCPRSNESAGKRRSTRLRDGAPWLKTILVQAAWAAARTKGSYERAQFLRLKSRRGPKKAIVAVAASMLGAAYHILRSRLPYRTLGANHFDQHDRAALQRRLVRRLEALGYCVDLKHAAA